LKLLSICLCQYTVQDTVNHLPTPILFPHPSKQIENTMNHFLRPLLFDAFETLAAREVALEPALLPALMFLVCLA
jgi:hypothetical protein